MKRICVAALAASTLVTANAAVNLVKNPSFESDDVAFRWGRMESSRETVKAKDDPR